MKKRIQQAVILFGMLFSGILLFGGCGKEKKDIAVQIETAYEAEVPEDSADDSPMENVLPEAVFKTSSEVTYEALVNCFRADYLLSVSSYVRRDQLYENYSTGEHSSFAAEYGWYDGYLAQHSISENNLTGFYEEDWINYDGHSVVSYYCSKSARTQTGELQSGELQSGELQTAETVEHVVYPRIDFSQSSRVMLVTDFRNAETASLISTEPLENGLYRSCVEYRNGNSLYATGIYEYDPLNVVLCSYEETMFDGAGEASVRITGTVAVSDEVQVDFDPSGIWGYTASADIRYEGFQYIIPTGPAETLFFRDNYDREGVLNYQVYSSSGQLLFSGYDIARLGSVSEDSFFTVETMWFAAYPQEAEPVTKTTGIPENYLTGTWTDNLTQPQYMLEIDEDLSFTCSRMDEDGAILNTYYGVVLTGNYMNVDPDCIDYLELSLARTDDSFFSGWTTLGDFFVVQTASGSGFCELCLAPAGGIDSLFGIYYGSTSPVWYKALPDAAENNPESSVQSGSDGTAEVPCDSPAQTGGETDADPPAQTDGETSTGSTAQTDGETSTGSTAQTEGAASPESGTDSSAQINGDSNSAGL